MQHRAPSQTGRTDTHCASTRTGTIAAQAPALAGGPAVAPLPCSATQDTPREARHNGQKQEEPLQRWDSDEEERCAQQSLAGSGLSQARPYFRKWHQH